MKKFWLTELTLLLVILVSPATASAACGDNVNGERVACRCGDVVVSDTQLLAGDPVVSEHCTSDGLFVRAKQGATSITLDLNGLALVGTGTGSGIRVIDGGSEGAVITGGQLADEGRIVGFAVGLSARGKRLVRSVTNLRVIENEMDGLVVDGVEAVVQNVLASGNGRDGVRVGGRDVSATGINTSDNGGVGVRTRGRSIRVLGTSQNDASGGLESHSRDDAASVVVVR